jgi:long-chain acyl-CoA synthetase
LTNHSYISKFHQTITEKIATNKLPKPQEDDMAALLYTSGTTGHSKGVMLSHKNLVTNAMSAYKNISIIPGDTFLSILPLAHTLECTVGMIVPILHGSDVVYIDKTPTPNVLIKAFATVKPTMMLSVPLIIEKIYKKKIKPEIEKPLVSFLLKLPVLKNIIHKKVLESLNEGFGNNLSK